MGVVRATYFEMGALDVVRFRNSHVFTHHLDFRGVLIEADPTNFTYFRKLKRNQVNRPKEGELAVVHTAVCDNLGEDPALYDWRYWARCYFRYLGVHV